MMIVNSLGEMRPSDLRGAGRRLAWRTFAAASLAAVLLAAFHGASMGEYGFVRYDYLSIQQGLASIPRAIPERTVPDSAAELRDRKSAPIDIRIVGGEFVVTDQFKEVVKIDYLTVPGVRSRCTGILLSRNAVLTAGHCSCGQVSSYGVRFRDETSRDEGRTLAGPPLAFPGFSCSDPFSLQSGRDLAVLFLNLLPTERRASDDLSRLGDNRIGMRRPTWLSSMHLLYKDPQLVRLTVVGYGLDESGSLPDDLKEGYVGIGSLFCSTGRFAGSACAGFREFVLTNFQPTESGDAVDTCGGDSGGPVFYFWVDELGEDLGFQSYSLVGITSRAVAGVPHIPGLSCGGGGIYTAVGHSDVLSWLRGLGIQFRFKS